MSSFLKAASKQVVDVKAFLRETATGNGIKYTMEKGVKHLIYIPYVDETIIDEESGNQITRRNLVAISVDLHEWTTADNKFKSAVCMSGKVFKNDDGNIINDGTCPFCDRVNDAWDIYNYRLESEEARCQLTGSAREEHMKQIKSSLAKERKADKARPYMYMLIVKYNTNDKAEPVIGKDGLPEYQLKVMKIARSTVDKLEQQMTNAGSELAGSEIVIEYPNVDDLRLLGSQRTTAPVFSEKRQTTTYPALLDKIKQDVAKFEWDSIEGSFPELKEIPTETAKTIVTNLFEQWDSYKKELVTNPSAKYLEYVVSTPVTAPNIGVSVPNVHPVANIGAVQVPTVPNVAPPVMPNIPTAPVVPTQTAPNAAPPVPPTNGNVGEAANGVFSAAPIEI